MTPSPFSSLIPLESHFKYYLTLPPARNSSLLILLFQYPQSSFLNFCYVIQYHIHIQAPLRPSATSLAKFPPSLTQVSAYSMLQPDQLNKAEEKHQVTLANLDINEQPKTQSAAQHLSMPTQFILLLSQILFHTLSNLQTLFTASLPDTPLTASGKHRQAEGMSFHSQTNHTACICSHMQSPIPASTVGEQNSLLPCCIPSAQISAWHTVGTQCFSCEMNEVVLLRTSDLQFPPLKLA